MNIDLAKAERTSDVPVTADLIASADVKLLTELGFCAIGRGLRKEARLIFSGLMRIRPHRAFPYVGMAMLHLGMRRPDEAIAVLQAADAVSPDERAEINAYLGLALHQAGRVRESRTALEAAARAVPVSEGVEFARQMLGKEWTG